jgi:hypothetical protein
MNQLYPNFKSATQKLLNQTPKVRAGTITNKNKKIIALLNKSYQPHRNHNQQILTKQTYQITFKTLELLKGAMNIYNETFKIINHNPKSAFNNKFENYGDYKIKLIDYNTLTIHFEKV